MPEIQEQEREFVWHCQAQRNNIQENLAVNICWSAHNIYCSWASPKSPSSSRSVWPVSSETYYCPAMGGTHCVYGTALTCHHSQLIWPHQFLLMSYYGWYAIDIYDIPANINTFFRPLTYHNWWLIMIDGLLSYYKAAATLPTGACKGITCSSINVSYNMMDESTICIPMNSKWILVSSAN